MLYHPTEEHGITEPLINSNKTHYSVRMILIIEIFDVWLFRHRTEIIFLHFRKWYLSIDLWVTIRLSPKLLWQLSCQNFIHDCQNRWSKLECWFFSKSGNNICGPNPLNFKIQNSDIYIAFMWLIDDLSYLF
jgi:hypothetical protein